MYTKLKYLILGIAFLWNINSLFAWISSNEGVSYTMDSLVQLSPDISYNAVDEMYEVDCDIIILENDTLKLQPGETVKFFSYPGGPPIRYEVIIYGNLIALGAEDKMITLGDPDCNLSTGDWWQGIKFINTSHNGESKLKYCEIRGAVSLQIALETAVYCENASPIFDHCIIHYLGSSEETGGASAIGICEQSYPVITYCNFSTIINGVAIWCNPYNLQDTINYPSPLMVGCNILGSVSGIEWYQSSHDKVVLFGGFLDNCYLHAGFDFVDTTLGSPLDTIGDGICTTTSTYDFKPRYLLVDGVVNPRSDPIITGINETETDILPTTSKYLVLKNNYPNPFTNHTTIEFEIKKEKSIVNLVVIDSKGNMVKTLISNESFSKGKHEVKWFGDNNAGQKVPEGIYFYKLVSENELLVKKAIVVK